jgi:hypothetical protein
MDATIIPADQNTVHTEQNISEVQISNYGTGKEMAV